MSLFDPINLKKQVAGYKQLTLADDFWQDVSAAQKISQQLKQAEYKLSNYSKLC